MEDVRRGRTIQQRANGGGHTPRPARLPQLRLRPLRPPPQRVRRLRLLGGLLGEVVFAAGGCVLRHCFLRLGPLQLPLQPQDGPAVLRQRAVGGAPSQGGGQLGGGEQQGGGVLLGGGCDAHRPRRKLQRPDPLPGVLLLGRHAGQQRAAGAPAQGRLQQAGEVGVAVGHVLGALRQRGDAVAQRQQAAVDVRSLPQALALGRALLHALAASQVNHPQPANQLAHSQRRGARAGRASGRLVVTHAGGAAVLGGCTGGCGGDGGFVLRLGAARLGDAQLQQRVAPAAVHVQHLTS